jgi:hypothetical protein
MEDEKVGGLAVASGMKARQSSRKISPSTYSAKWEFWPSGLTRHLYGPSITNMAMTDFVG